LFRRPHLLERRRAYLSMLSPRLGSSVCPKPVITRSCSLHALCRTGRTTVPGCSGFVLARSWRYLRPSRQLSALWCSDGGLEGVQSRHWFQTVTKLSLFQHECGRRSAGSERLLVGPAAVPAWRLSWSLTEISRAW